MGLLNGFLAGAGEQLVSIADQRLAKYHEEDLMAARQAAEIAKEKRIEEMTIRGEGRAATADTTRRGLIQSEKVAADEADFKRKNDPSYVQTEIGTAKAKSKAAGESALENKQAEMRAMATPEMLAAERKIADAKESSSTRASAAATWFKLSTDKKVGALEDAYTAAVKGNDPAAIASAKKNLDAHNEALAKPQSAAERASTLATVEKMYTDLGKSMETTVDETERAAIVAKQKQLYSVYQAMLPGKADAGPKPDKPFNPNDFRKAGAAPDASPTSDKNLSAHPPGPISRLLANAGKKTDQEYLAVTAKDGKISYQKNPDYIPPK